MNVQHETPTDLEGPSPEKTDKKEIVAAEEDSTKITEAEVEVTNPPTVNEEKSVTPCPELPATLHERFLRVKQIVKDAIAAHHTFMIYGRSRVIRDCMLKRGWCEKFFRKNASGDHHLNIESSPVILLAGLGDLKDQQSERQLISRMLNNHTVDFLWNTGAEWPGWPAQDNKTTIFNRYFRAAFTSKVGLCSNVKQMHWYYEPGVANTLFPRCYNLSQGDQMHAFIDDFRLTACLSLLKWLVNKMDDDGENAVGSPTGTVPLKAIEFAIKRCTDYISAQAHEDIDQESERVWSHQWDQFISWYYQIVQGQAFFIQNNQPFQKYVLASKHILKKMRKYRPQIDMDGIMNMWIMKPGNKSRGRGIVLVNKLEDVMAKMNSNNKTDNRFVVQKYIERPLLIYNTKFDIRQWFIVTCAQPLTLWMYRESYLRFCSQNFNLSDFHESIHLCNHAIQCKYTNCGDRDPALPTDNMWDATTFKQYLKSQGHTAVWDQLIYPGMKQGLIGSLLASQEAMDRRKNSFELYGADFMVMDDFSVWLIEINSHPDMSYSTSVTTRLCRQVMEDTIKVVIDLRENKQADTGEFEMVYKQRMPTCQPYLGAALSLQGTRVTTYEKKSNSNHSESKMNLPPKSPVTFIPKKKAVPQQHLGPVIVDLIEELEIQLDQEFYAYFKSESPKHRQVLPATAPAKSSKTAILIDKGVSVVKSTSASTMTGHHKSKSPMRNQQGSYPRSNAKTVPKPTRKSRTFSGLTNKQVSSGTGQSLISKIMALQQQSSSMAQKSGKVLRQNDEKAVNSAVQNAVKKYKRSATLPTISAGLPPLPSVTKPGNKESQPGTTRNKNRTVPKRQVRHKKNSVLTDITDMYALGLGLTK